MSSSRPSGPRRNTTLSKDSTSSSNLDSALTSTIDPEDGSRPEDLDRPRLGRRTTISSTSTATTNNNSTTTTSDQPNRPGLERGSSSAFIGGSLHRPSLTQARSRGKSFIGSTSLQDDLVLPYTTISSTITSDLTTTPKRESKSLALNQEKDEDSDTLQERLITRNSPRNTLSPLISASTTSTDPTLTTKLPRSSKLGRGSLARRASSSSSLSTISALATAPTLALSSTSKSTLASKEVQTGSSTGSTNLLSPLREDIQLGPPLSPSSSTSPSSSNLRAKSKPRPHRSASVRDVPAISIHLEGVPLEDDHDHDHDMDLHHENAQASSSSSSRMSAPSSSSQSQSQPKPTGRRGNRPASKSVSSVLGRPSHLAGIARTSTHHAEGSNPNYTPERRAPSILLDRIGEFEDERYAHLQQRRPSRDESAGIENKSSGSNSTIVAAGTTVTRSRSTSIAKHPEVVDLHARHSRPYDPTSNETLGGGSSSSPAPTRLGLTRRTSAPNVRSPGSGSALALPGGMKDDILPTLPVGPEDVGGTNSLGLSKVSPGRSRGFQRFSPSPSLEPRIMEESGSQPSSPELDLDLDGPPPARALVLSPPPGRTSLSTIASTTEGEGSVSTVDRTASYPITPRGSIPNEEDNAGNSGFNVIGGVIQGLSKAVGFNLSKSARYSSVSHHDYAADEDDNETDQQRQTRSWISMGKRRSLEDTDSEKGLSREPSDDEGADAARSGGARSTRTGGSSSRRPDGGSYFFLEPYASQEASGSSRGGDTLPTPALSRASLSGLQARPAAGRTSSSLFERRRPGAAAGSHGFAASLWRVKDYLAGTSNKGQSEAYVMKHSGGFSSPEAKAERLARGRSDSLLLPKLDADDTAVGMNTAFRQVVGELGWTLGLMGIVFFASFGLVAFGIKSMPITSLHSLPKKVSDLQILSAEIRAYMSSSSRGWWHTVCVLMITGMWKHSWSIPGALILNILVGSLLSPIPALILLTVITSFGSLGAYMLSRPLAPLIALLFPKPLAIVRSAIKGNAEPAPSIGPYQAVRKPSAAAEGGVWRRLLIMRAMGLVPWSGMNVACGVVGVSWLTFLLTTAAGSASWSYVTASVGDILGQLALPKDPGNGDTDPNAGQSIASLVQDPALIAKMVVLSLISLIPALFKSRSGTIDTAPPAEIEAELEAEYHHPHVSQDAQAMTPLAPTASWWQVVHFANLLIRKTTRIAHTGWNAVAGEARDEYRHLQPASE